jgi:hypothetical protein
MRMWQSQVISSDVQKRKQGSLNDSNSCLRKLLKKVLKDIKLQDEKLVVINKSITMNQMAIEEELAQGIKVNKSQGTLHGILRDFELN